MITIVIAFQDSAYRTFKNYYIQQVMPDIEYLRYSVDKRNIPSRKIPESLGGVAAEEYSKTNLGGKVLHIIEYRLYK